MKASYLESSISAPEENYPPLQAILLEILKNLDTKKITYAVLTPCTEFPPDTSSDVDILFADDPRATIEPILLKMQRKGGIELLIRHYYEAPGGYWFFLRPSHENYN
jgi:hypothetical protein